MYKNVLLIPPSWGVLAAENRKEFEHYLPFNIVIKLKLRKIKTEKLEIIVRVVILEKR